MTVAQEPVLRLNRVHFDRSHYPPPGGHVECGRDSCLASELLVKEHHEKYYSNVRTWKPSFYNGSSESTVIREDRKYLVYIDSEWMDSGGWHMGSFSRQHYGWNFWPWGTSGIQLSGIWLVYEIIGGLPTEDLHDPNRPAPKPECNCGCDEERRHFTSLDVCPNCDSDCPGRET